MQHESGDCLVPQNFSRYKVIRETGLTKRVTMRTLRHCFATHPVGVAAEVMIGLGGTAERPLGVDDPVLSSEFPEEARELHRVFQTGNPAPQSALTESLLRGLQKLAPDDLREGPDGEEEAVSGCDPSAAIRTESPARDHQVQMGVKVEVLIPGVQDSYESHLGLQTFIVPGQLEESLGGALKEEIEHECRVEPGQELEFVGQGDHQVEGGDGQKALPARRQPLGLLEAPAP